MTGLNEEGRKKQK